MQNVLDHILYKQHAAAGKMLFLNNLPELFNNQKLFHNPDLSTQCLCFSFSDQKSLDTSMKCKAESGRM